MEAKPNPRLGRVAAGFIALCFLLYLSALVVMSRQSTGWGPAFSDILGLLVAAATLTSLVAVARRSSRTLLAWVVLGVGICFWLVEISAAFAGM